MISNTIQVNKGWTLFLDRDGVINAKRDHDYVKCWEEFSFLHRSTEAIATFSEMFERILVVTNQRGVGKGLMTEEQLNYIHQKMCDEIIVSGGKIEKVYYCVDLLDSSECRKPNIGMGLKAKLDFPEIDFSKSIIIGDSMSDMLFGKKLGMLCIFIGENKVENALDFFDHQFKSLIDCASFLRNQSI